MMDIWFPELFLLFKKNEGTNPPVLPQHVFQKIPFQDPNQFIKSCKELLGEISGVGPAVGQHLLEMIPIPILWENVHI